MDKHQEIVVVEFCFFNTLITVFAYPKGREDQRKEIKLDYHAVEKKKETPAVEATTCFSWFGF